MRTNGVISFALEQVGRVPETRINTRFVEVHGSI